MFVEYDSLGIYGSCRHGVVDCSTRFVAMSPLRAACRNPYFTGYCCRGRRKSLYFAYVPSVFPHARMVAKCVMAVIVMILSGQFPSLGQLKSEIRL